MDGSTPPTGKYPNPDQPIYNDHPTRFKIGNLFINYEHELGNVLPKFGASFIGDGVKSQNPQFFEVYARVPGERRSSLSGNPAGYWLSDPYFVPNHRATCGDVSCLPNMDVTLYGRWGSVKGKVRLLDGTKIPFSFGLRAHAATPLPPDSGNAFADQWAFTNFDGEYNFAAGRMLIPQDPLFWQCAPPFNLVCHSIPIPLENEWALRVLGDGGVDGDKSKLQYSNGPGTYPWTISLSSKRKADVEVRSSTASLVDFYLRLDEVFPILEEQLENRPECLPPGGLNSGIGTNPLTGGDSEACSAGANGACPVGSHPVSLVTGNVFLDQTDVRLPGVHYDLAFPRSYNSFSPAANRGALGRGWNHAYEQRIEVISPQILRMWSAKGAARYLTDPDEDQVFAPFGATNSSSTITQTPGGFARTLRSGWREEYDTSGRLLRVVDRLNRATELVRDEFGRIERMTSPEGRWLKLEYDFPHPTARLARLVGPEGTIAEYSYSLVANQELMLARVRYVDGTGYRFTYNDDFQLLTVADLAGVVLDRHGYASDKKAAWSERDGGRERLTYSFEEGRTVVTNARGGVSVWEFTRKPSGVVVSRVTGCTFCGGSVGTRIYEHDDQGRVTRYVDADNGEIVYTYSGENLVAVRNALSRTTTFGGHDSFGRPGTVTVPGFGTTTYAWALEGPASVTPPAGPAAFLSYSNGRLSGVSAGGLSSSVEINERGELVSLKDPRNNTTSFTHDPAGRLKTIRRPDLTTTSLHYDGRGRLVSLTRPDGNRLTFSYDASGRQQASTDEAGRTTRYAYDRYGNLEVVLDPLGGSTRFTYDLMSNLASVVDAKGQKTSFEYDEWGRLLKMIDPMNGQEEYTYSPGGRLLTRRDRRGITTTYSYDAAGRLTGKSYSNGDPSVTIEYHDDDRQVTIANGTDTVILTADTAGRLTSETSAFNGTSVSYAYNADGLLSGLSLDGAPVASYAYVSGVLSTITSGNKSFQFLHDSLLRRQRLTYPNGIQTDYTFDSLSRLTGIQAGSVLTASYTHDVIGNRVSKSVESLAESYGYDALDRLTAVARPAGAQGSQAFSYDRVGNRTGDQRDGLGRAYAFDARNRVTSAVAGPMLVAGSTDEPATVVAEGQPARILPGNAFEVQVPAASTFTVQATDASGNTRTTTYHVSQIQGSATFTYDESGNLLSKTEGTSTTSYEWNAVNQLVRVTKDGNELARFKYDPFGRRVEKVAGGVTTVWAYDGADILRETIDDGTTTTTYRYIHGPAIDEPLAKENVTTDAAEYYHADGLGSIMKMTDQAGTVTRARQYDAWGNPELGADQPGYAFTGREWDPETQLYYYRARYLEPKLGRFISEDPIGFDAGMNFYAYVSGSPVNMVDSGGLDEHHIVVQRAWLDLELRPEVKRILKDTVVESGDHAYFREHRAYNALVRQMWENTFKGVASKDITEEMIKDFIKTVQQNPQACQLNAEILKRGGVRTLPGWLARGIKGVATGLVIGIALEILLGGEPLALDPGEVPPGSNP